ncbi:antibiotic biosynthesis monooxygenase [Amycolatopsis sp., V23-08]|uniref:Antibiotic biosynthesis monooxygenase n=1 Tax=Amycolatopsis heterodermiae TaxID=3110235 RepID=A0ABU5RG70_9PSEU|nr:antibiotic biosynthesis monooxygenase [Amycolatopsis sp., V23-08]MEA5365276.1 antibiotic biosynthesis monooxygenase [Amycolatopsis sp., V23-08]
MTETPTVGLLVTMEAKAGREGDVEKFLESGRALVDEEPATTAWFAFRLGGTTFGIYDVFPDEPGREAHLNGKVAEALMAQAPDLFTATPVIQRVDILASKLP